MKNSVQIVQDVQSVSIVQVLNGSRSLTSFEMTAGRFSMTNALIVISSAARNLLSYSIRYSVRGNRGHLRFSVHTSGGGGTIDLPVLASTMEPSAGQYMRQTVHFG